MGSKSKYDALKAMKEYTNYRWELLRRNEDYRREYDRLFRKYMTKKEYESLNLPEWNDSMSDSVWVEKLEAWKRLHKEYESRMGVSYKDMKKIQNIKQNPNDSFRDGNLYVVAFCGCWGLRYPKDYKEDVERKVDWSLFCDYGWINSTGWELPAYGLSSHLNEILAGYAINKLDTVEKMAHSLENHLESSMQFWRDFYDRCVKDGEKEAAKQTKALVEEREKMLEASRKNPSYSSEIAALKESELVLKEDGAHRRKNGERVIVININFSDDMIVAYISKLLENERKDARRKQLRLPDQWGLSFDIWDARQEGKTFPEIQEIIFQKTECQVNWDVSTIDRRYRRIEREIRQMSERNAARKKT